MARSVKKGPYVAGYILKKVDKARADSKKTVIKIWDRASTILPQFIDLTFAVYNGKQFVPVLVTDNMVGHKFGEFAPTRNFSQHTAAGADKTAKK